MDDEFEEPEIKTRRLPKVAKVKNKAPAPVQITAEQLLREAKERQLEFVPPPPKQKISDPQELQEYRLRKRKFFEDNIRKNRSTVSNWLKYAAWEESQKEIQRARSIYERALEMNHRNVTIWLKYAEMEMKLRQINHARNIWDRAVTILPRVNQFWYKYTYMEEMLGNIPAARQVFERWMEWEPEEQAWLSYIKMELRYKEVDRARAVYEHFVMCHHNVKNWIRFARFEESQGNVANARIVYERAVEFYGEDNMDENLFIAFARFEETQREFDRVRVLYKYALEKIPKQYAQELFKNYTTFEKRFGDRSGIEDVIVSKRRFQYEEEVKLNPNNYDAWFDYIRLVESDGDIDTIREVYERAIANIPPVQEKKHWRRYIYLWIMYALFEELHAKDEDRTRQVYKACLEVIPHKKFTFAKIWLFYAQFEIRRKNLKAARIAMGTGIGKCPKNKLFREYISIELQLREFDRCRKLYEKFLEFNPSNCTTWIKYSEMETILGDIDRARGIYELAISQPLLDMPEVLWKAYIDFEIGLEEYDRTRQLYDRLLQRTQHVKVWISYAEFETTTEEEASIDKARVIFKRGDKTLKGEDSKEERMLLLEAWKKFEYKHGDTASQMAVDKMMPRKVKKRRKVQTEDMSDAGWEEYFDYIFPDDEDNQPNFKLLQMAKMWKQTTADSSDSDSDESESETVVDSSKKQKEKSETESESSDSEEDNEKEEEEKQDLPFPLPLKDIDKDEEFSDETSSEEEEK
ncbi:crooked neck-like protein 1 [Hydractinia symbiolongicarpus]|uniref:crooked neck-like protein 1 n=1 Tax=Hydractinia symbiolongicarpus TaxID=13093 RepID=UPI00254D0FE6|nr:crooked neck-like protein 1 [Hydractinia symbiolongicarpus]